MTSLALEIPLAEGAARGFHFIGDNSRRFNYAGPTPLGRTTWYREPWDHWVPIRKRTEPGPPDGEVWNSSQVEQYSNAERADHRPSVPYLWLGTEERGLAWFADNEAGWVTDFRRPLQRVFRRGGAVVMEIDLVQVPVTFAAPRTITFGLMASPGKPMEPAFRTRPVAHGIGPVSCWGGWLCASKYPTDGDFEIVDKIQEARRTGMVDQASFEERGRRVAEAWPGRKIHGSTDWLGLTLHMTNTQTLPFNTWATATLDLEQLAHTADPAAGPPGSRCPVLSARGSSGWRPPRSPPCRDGRRRGVRPGSPGPRGSRKIRVTPAADATYSSIEESVHAPVVRHRGCDQLRRCGGGGRRTGG